ncbi:MAG: hypothetical protein V1676_02335 [Candidatus Diapherotrites archaeon]
MKANPFTAARNPAKIKVVKKLPLHFAEEARKFLEFHPEGPKSKDHFREIVRSAEGLLRRRFPKKSRMIFVGQGMHHLFRAFVTLNKYYAKRPPGFARYFVTPSRDGREKATLIGAEELIAKKLRGLGIVSGGVENYYIADVSSSGRTYDATKAAILRLNPDAKVSLLSGSGITSSDLMERHAVKDSEGRLKRSNNQFSIAQSLAFRLYLEEYLAAREPKIGLLARMFNRFGK